jgi:hypothetical protein
VRAGAGVCAASIEAATPESAAAHIDGRQAHAFDLVIAVTQPAARATDAGPARLDRGRRGARPCPTIP